MMQTRDSESGKVITIQQYGHKLIQRAIDLACKKWYAQAESTLKDAEKVLENYPTGIIEVMITKGVILELQGDLEAALSMHTEVDKMIRETPNDVDTKAVTIKNQTRIHWVRRCLEMDGVVMLEDTSEAG